MKNQLLTYSLEDLISAIVDINACPIEDIMGTEEFIKKDLIEDYDDSQINELLIELQN